MTVWGVHDIAGIWLRNGGSPAAVVDAVAVALAESGGNDHAISPSHDFGLWQINWIHFGYNGIALNNWMDPNVNARSAIAISGNGTNWAPWCTCWVDPASNCGHGLLRNPEPASPAGQHVHAVAVALGTPADQSPPPTQQSGQIGVQRAWAMLQGFIGNDAVYRYRQLDSLSYRTKGNRR